MRKLIFTSLIALCVCGTISAQNYQDSRYYNPQTGRLDYSRGEGYDVNGRHYAGRTHHWFNSDNDTYVGVRLGPTFSKISSDDDRFDGGNIKSGVYVGLALGTRISRDNPVYLESGLYFTQKGGKGKQVLGVVNSETLYTRFSCDLQYLEIPLLVKYRYPINNHVKLEPFLGAYFDIGVGGKIKNYSNREAYSSFSNTYDSSFKRCDGGIKFGTGLSYDVFYLELGYDWGLTNISHDDFDTSHNGALYVDLGVNF